MLGDVLFVRQTDRNHYEVAGLLSALRKHGRQTLILDAPQNAPVRNALEKSTTVQLRDTPLASALQTISKLMQIEIRLDLGALKALGIRDRTPVSIELADQKLSVILHTFLSDLNLTWIVRDGVLWVTSQKIAEGYRKTAVYNVTDLCMNELESASLEGAILSQTRGTWDGKVEKASPKPNPGVINFAKPGVMVVRQTEWAQAEVLQLLENYRIALRGSKARKPEGIDPNEIVTRYYRIPNVIADELVTLLPQSIKPESWKSQDNPMSIGVIRKLKSVPSILRTQPSVSDEEDTGDNSLLVVENSVLVIKQSRALHQEIAELIQKIEYGDSLDEGLMDGGSFGGGGGFGQGFFNIAK